TNHCVFSIRESRQGLRLPAASWHFTCIPFPRPWLLKPPTNYQNDESSSRTSPFTRGWHGLLFAVFGGGSMKVMRSAFLGLGLLLAVSAAQAQEPRVKANIPFDFVVGDRVLPAGEYTVSQVTGEAIAILSEDRKANALTVTSACASADSSKSTRLVFHALGGRYFLSQIWVAGYSQGRQLR